MLPLNLICRWIIEYGDNPHCIMVLKSSESMELFMRNWSRVDNFHIQEDRINKFKPHHNGSTSLILNSKRCPNIFSYCKITWNIAHICSLKPLSSSEGVKSGGRNAVVEVNTVLNSVVEISIRLLGQSRLSLISGSFWMETYWLMNDSVDSSLSLQYH